MAFDPITAGIGLVTSIIDRVLPDKAASDAAKLELLKLQMSGELAQLTAQTDINKEEAKHASIFVAGWRPFIGWVCGAACAWNWVGISVAETIAGFILTTPPVLRHADLTEMMPVLLGLLGLGAMRSYETVKGVARTTLGK